MLNSVNSCFSNDLNLTSIQLKIKKEFEFFDETYFKTKDEAFLRIFLMGNGQDGEGTPTDDCPM